MGTPWRSKKFHDAYLRQHGRQHACPIRSPACSSSPSGIPGSISIAPASGATPAAATRRPAAMFRYPDFFKVGISEAGNHDNRNYEDDWAEKWQRPA